jgi:hypothetical protein
MAGDHRTRRLTEDPPAAQRTLDAPREMPAAPEEPVEIDPSEVLEPPPPQRAGARLEERQKRWFQLRDRAEHSARRTTDTVGDPRSDPKG